MVKARVLIVEDEPDIAETLALVLQRSGHETATAEHGAAALDRIEHGFRPSIILLDLMMPVMDGHEFLAAIADVGDLREIPVIVFSGDHRRAAAARGPSVVARLGKPIELGVLLETIESFARVDGR